MPAIPPPSPRVRQRRAVSESLNKYNIASIYIPKVDIHLWKKAAELADRANMTRSQLILSLIEEALSKKRKGTKKDGTT